MSIPTWLQNGKDLAYVEKIFQELAERETRRAAARAASRPEPEHGPRRFNRLRRPKSSGSSADARNLHKEHYSVAIGSHHTNLERNRYLEVEPYDRTRVVVTSCNGANGSEDTQGRYLNASWVLERFGQKWWIATQAPLPFTAHTFLSLILQPNCEPPVNDKKVAQASSCRIRTVVQLTRFIEDGRRKAHAYFPSTVGHSMILPPEPDHDVPALRITLKDCQTLEEAHCIHSTLSVVPLSHRSPVSSHEGSNEGSDSSSSSSSSSEDDYGEEDGIPIIFNHLLYASWPDFGIPEPQDRLGLLAFLRLVDSINRDTSQIPPSVDPTPHPDPPIVIGCSAGIGRTGSFITLSSLLRKFGALPPPHSPTPASFLSPSPLGPLPAEMDNDLVAQEVDSLREQRPGMVQREEQLCLVYEILTTAISQL